MNSSSRKGFTPQQNGLKNKMSQFFRSLIGNAGTRSSYRFRSGFTLIEILIVMAIIGILAAVGLNNFSGSRSKARDVRRKSDLASMRTALQLYYTNYNRFPAAGGGGTFAGCGAAGTSSCAWGGTFSAGNPTVTYMGIIPRDPMNTGTYVYTYAASATVDYTITAMLENLTDTDSARSQQRCGVASPVAGIFMVCNQ